MAFDEALADVVTVTAGNVAASAGDMIFVYVREIISSAALPSGTGLPTFDLVTLTSGDANNGANSVRGAWYRTLCGISFNTTLSFANSAFGYAVYVYSGLDTGGSNGANSVVQACGQFDATAGVQTVSYGSAVTSGNLLVAGFVGGAPNDINPIDERSGWTNDYGLWITGNDVFLSAQSRATSDTAADATFNGNFSVCHGVALELKVASAGGGGNWNYYSQQ